MVTQVKPGSASGEVWLTKPQPIFFDLDDPDPEDDVIILNVPHADVLVVVVEVAVDVGELSAHGVEDGFGGAGVPLFAAWTGEDVRVGLPLDQEHHL